MTSPVDPFVNYIKNLTPSGALIDYYGKGLLPALNLPGKAIRSAISPGFDEEGFNRAMDTGGRLGMIGGPLSMPIQAGGALGFQWADYLTGSKMSAGLEDAARKIPNGDVGAGIMGLWGSAAFDPLTYLGAGAGPTTASKTLLGQVSPRLAQAESVFQSGLNKALLAPALLPKAALNTPIPGIGNVLKRAGTNLADDAVTSIPAQSIGDYLWGGPSRRAQLHQYSQDIEDISSRLMERGHDLELDVVDLLNMKSGNIVKAWDQDAPQHMADIRARLQDIITSTRFQDPSLGNAVKQALNEQARRVPAGASQDEIYRWAQMFSDTGEHIADLINKGGATPDTVWDAARRRMDSLDLLSNQRTGVLSDLPSDLRTRAEVAFGAMSKHAQQLQTDRGSIEKALEAYWDLENGRRGGALGKYQPIANATATDVTTEINNRLQQLGLGPITATGKNPFSAQFRDLMAGRIDDVTHNKMSDALRSWGASGDPLTENVYKLITDKTIRDRATQLGMDTRYARALKPIENLMSAWKTIQLMSPGYLTNNALSGILMSGMVGVSPGEISRNLGRNIFRSLRGEPLILPELAAQNARLGRDVTHVPSGIGEATGLLEDANALRDLSGKGQDILTRIGAPRMAIAGGIGGAAAGAQRAQETPDDDLLYQTLKGTAVGAATLGTMPVLSRRLYQPLTQGIEHTLRSSALVEGRNRFFAGQTDPLIQSIRQAVPTISPAVLDGFAQATRQQGGMVSEQALDRFLRTVGASPEARSQVIQGWADTVRNADLAGVDLSNSINFDYGRLNNFEEFARQVFPFSTWATKAFPFFAQRVAENPAIGSAVARYEDASTRAREDQGLSPRFAGSIEIPAANDLWSALTGRPGSHAFFNPLKALFPAADAARTAAFEPRDAQTTYQHMTRLLDTIGFAEHPIMGMLARLTNQDPGAPAEGFSIRQGSPVQALTGVNLNGPGAYLERSIRQGLGQEEPADGRTQATLRRIDERALRDSGKPIGGNDPILAPFVRAKVDRSGPIWDAALRDVDRERGARSLSGFITGPGTPTGILGPEEARISEARSENLIPAELSRNISTRASVSPTLPADPQTIATITGAVQELVRRNVPDGQIPKDVQAKLDNPTWKNIRDLQNQIYDAQAVSSPELRAYAGSGSAEKQRLQHALQMYNNMDALILKTPAYSRFSPEERALTLKMIREGTLSRFTKFAPDAAQYTAAIKSERERILRDTPALAAYFDYRKSQPPDQASLDDFLQNVWPTLRAGR